MRCLVLTAAVTLLASGGGTAAPQSAKEEVVPADLMVDHRLRQPLDSRNEFPVALWFLYLSPERARTLPEGAIALFFNFSYSNIMVLQEGETETLTLDAEYLSTVFTLKRGLPHDFEIFVDLPFYVFYGGFLDPVIDKLHRTFDLPNFIRGQTPYGLVQYEYSRNGASIVSHGDSKASFGDVSFGTKKFYDLGDGNELGLRGALKLPTGSPSRLSGSGSVDAGLGVAFNHIARRFGFYGNANYHFLGASELVPSRNYWSFMVGADWRFKKTLTAVLQFDHLSPFVHGEVRLLSQSGQQVALGLRWHRWEHFVLEWRFVEDVSTTSPDVTFGFRLGFGWSRASEE